MTDHFTLSLCVGAVAGAICVIPMLVQRSSFGACLAAFCTYLFTAVLVFYGNLPFLPWWADGMGVALMLTLPQVFAGKDGRTTSAMLLYALLLGFLISVAQRCLG